MSPKSNSSKPVYRVPLMAEIAQIKPNGLTVISTFAGCGGSSTGYRMAGYKVLLANEFVPIAQESYRANMSKDTILDGRDIKAITAEDILAVTGLKRGDLDLFDGSPPCQAFSTAGKRAKGWGTDRKYEHGASQKNEDLFDEYVRLRDGLMPKVFVAENVSGLVKGVAKGYFLRILAELKRGYRVEARLLDAQWLGVPQQRQRIIFIGIRDDLGLDPVFPSPLPYRYSVRDAIPWIISAESGPTGFGVGSQTANAPAPTIPASMQAPYGAHKVEARVIYQDDYGKSDEDVTDRPARSIRAGRPNVLSVEKETDISRYAIGAEYDKLNPGGQSDKYFSLVKTDASAPAPAPTMTASDGKSSSIACAVHPTEKRKFSIAELRRICAFPDDFVLIGSYAQQWERLGNSVPPLMMKAIAEAIRDRILLPAKAAGNDKSRRSAPAKVRELSPAVSAKEASRAPHIHSPVLSRRRRGARP